MTLDRNEPPAGGTTRRGLDTLNAVLAVWLFISPWVLTYGTGDSWNTWIVSAIIFLAALSSLSRPNVWAERLTLVLGAWMFISPWVFAFSSPSPGASWNQWLTGALIFLVSLAAQSSGRMLSPAAMREAHGHR